MERSTTPPDEHLASLPEAVRADVTSLDAEISRVMTGEERVLWEGPMWGGTQQRIIGYGAFVQRQRTGDVDWFIIGLAVQKAHLSLYVNAAEAGEYLAQRYASRLGRVKVGSANVTFRRLADLDLAVVLEMVERARELVRGPMAQDDG
jgi:hypothetical protein